MAVVGMGCRGYWWLVLRRDIECARYFLHGGLMCDRPDSSCGGDNHPPRSYAVMTGSFQSRSQQLDRAWVYFVRIAWWGLVTVGAGGD